MNRYSWIKFLPNLHLSVSRIRRWEPWNVREEALLSHGHRTGHCHWKGRWGSEGEGTVWQQHHPIFIWCKWSILELTELKMMEQSSVSTEFPIPLCVDFFRLSFRELCASLKPAQAVCSCKTGPTAGHKITHFSRKISMNDGMGNSVGVSESQDPPKYFLNLALYWTLTEWRPEQVLHKALWKWVRRVWWQQLPSEGREEHHLGGRDKGPRLHPFSTDRKQEEHLQRVSTEKLPQRKLP